MRLPLGCLLARGLLLTSVLVHPQLLLRLLSLLLQQFLLALLQLWRPLLLRRLLLRPWLRCRATRRCHRAVAVVSWHVRGR